MSTDQEAPAYSVALSFEDGVTRFITCRADQVVADAAYRQRVNIPLDCRDGACGTCKALCESGSYDGGSYVEDALSPAEEEQGYVLPCSMRPRSDLVLQITGTSQAAKVGATRCTATVTGLELLSPTTAQLEVEVSDGDAPAFLPGQYVNIAVPGTDQTRSYSFSNAPGAGRLGFLIRITPGGAMSDWLTQRAAVGDRLELVGPHGSFFLRESDRPVLMLAGGTGLAPVLSMLRALRESGSERRVHLVYGVSTDTDLVALDQIEELAAALPHLTWDHCVSDPGSSAANKGYVTSLIRPEHLHGGDVAVYLCGPPPMVESVRAHLHEQGVEPSGFFYEKFTSAAPAGAEEPAIGGTPVVADAAEPDLAEQLLPAGEGRALAGQEVLAADDLAPWAGPVAATDTSDAARRVAGQLVVPPDGESGAGATALDPERAVLLPVGEGRAVAGQEVFASALPAEPFAPAAPPRPAQPAAAAARTCAAEGGQVLADGYEIGEEHPDVRSSDALFEARAALELGALELTIGRLSTQQLAGYRLLAESTLPYVDGERLLDAAAYTETNAAFHDYLFAQTGNEHLLEAYHALGVKGRMAEVLREATWCAPGCATDHVEIVDAVEAGDRQRARDLVTGHAERAKATMRRAMADTAAARRPRFLSPGRFDGQVVAVTGAAQGIGAQVARRVAAEGGTVVLADRSALVGEVVDEITGTGSVASGVECDLETWEGAEALGRAVLERHGRVDVLVNNVGGAILFKPFTEFTAAEIQAEVTRSLMTTRAVLPSMVEAGRGVVVNVSSCATRGIHRIPYSAAKGGVNALTASLALEYAPHGIRVVATAPGGTQAPPRRISRGTPEPADETERAWFQAHIDQTLASSALGRYGTLDEQAAAICFLASPEASYITGSVLPVAGGDLG